MITLQMFVIAVEIAVVVYVFSCVLIQQGHLFEWYLDLLLKLERSKIFGWLAKPLGLCEVCLAGQSSFWIGIYLMVSDPPETLLSGITKHIVFISFTILFTLIFKKEINGTD